MSTNSRIAVVQKNGKVKSIYCHWDGYLSGVGQTLVDHYNDEKKANALVKLGDISCLYKHIKPLKEAPEAFFHGEGKPRILKAKEHNFNTQQKDVTVAYHRDRGEDYNQDINKSLEDFIENGDLQGYDYIFKDGKWFVLKGKILVRLTKKYINETE